MRSKHCSLVAVGCLIECLLKCLSDHLALFTFFTMFLRKRNSGDRGNGNVGGGGGNTVARWWLWLNGRDGVVVVLIRKCFLPLKSGSRFFSLLTFILHCIELHKIQKMFWCFFFFFETNWALILQLNLEWGKLWSLLVVCGAWRELNVRSSVYSFLLIPSWCIGIHITWQPCQPRPSESRWSWFNSYRRVINSYVEPIHTGLWSSFE